VIIVIWRKKDIHAAENSLTVMIVIRMKKFAKNRECQSDQMSLCKNRPKCSPIPFMCSDKGYDDFKGLFQSVEYIHRRTQMITAGIAVAVTFYRIESSAL
jgi:hypothetical protein